MLIKTNSQPIDKWDQNNPEPGIYTVYAMEIYNDPKSDLIEKGNIIYVVDTSMGLRGFNSKYFDIIDPRISRFWNIYIGNGFCELGTDIWVGDSEFQSKVMYDDDEKSIKLFQPYKTNMELEFPDHDLENVILVDGNWIQCPKCQNIWENHSDLGQVICPNCENRMNNPIHLNLPLGKK